MAELAIKISDLRKTYQSKRGHKEALKGINLEIEQGSFFGLLGPNGAGKSTIINIMAGTVIKTSGKLEICGYDIDENQRLAKKQIGIVPQELILDTFFTVREALDLHAGYYGIAKRDRITDELIEALGLSDKANVSSRGLSGGMRRRLLICKALVHKPKVLILDEPTAGVDVELREQLWDYVVDLNKQGVTILLTTHYLEEAEKLCDKIAIINHGEVIANESKTSLLSRLDRKKMIIKTHDNLQNIPQVMIGQGFSLQNGKIEVEYSTSSNDAERILSIVRDSGVQIADISTVEASLEDVFKNIVRGG
jgi:ABC-2 type transport system ATP-binding protein